MTDRPWSLRVAHWPEDINPIRAVRTEVFIEEQHVTPDEEWDGIDDQCLHVLAFVDDEPVATARLLPDGKIGRMAVRKPWRGQGIGGAMLEMLMAEARDRGHDTVKLAAQTHAIPFYEHYGFRTYGNEFLDANMPHYWMKVSLAPQSNRASGKR